MASFARRPAPGVRFTGLPLRSISSFPVLLTSALAAQLVVLAPVIDTAYWGDDSANAYILGYLRTVGQHWWPFIVTANKIQWQGFGRLMPLGVLQTYGAFYVLGDRVAYKILLISLTLVASGMVALLVRRLGAPPGFAALCAGLPAIVWQFHLLHDPLISYAGLMQAVTIYITGAMLTFLGWLRRGGLWRLALVVLLTFCACITYESAYLLVAAMVLIAWRERGGAIWRAVVRAWPGLTVAGAFIVVAAVRTHSLPSKSGYHPSTDLGVIASAWAKIIASGLPLIGRVATPGPETVPAAAWAGSVVRGVLVAALLLPLLIAATRSGRWEFSRRLTLTVGGTGIVLLLASSLLTAVAPQYQHLVEWGWGYLPMFFVGLGWGILGALAVAWALARLAGRSSTAVGVSVALALGLGAIAAINANANARVVQYMQPDTQSRDLLEAGFQHGILGRVPTHGTVLWYLPDVVVPFGAWDPGEMDLGAWTRQFVNRPLTMHLIPGSEPDADVCTNSADGTVPCQVLTGPTFWLRTGLTRSLRFVAVAEVGLGRWQGHDNTMTTLSRPGSQPVVFVQDPQIGPGSLPFEVTLSRPGSPAPIVVDSRRLQVLRQGAGWVLAALPSQPAFTSFTIQVSPR